MGRAGLMLADFCSKDLSLNKSTRIGIFCGPGNNGGDGFALAMFLRRKGYRDLTVFYSKKPSEMRSDCRYFYRHLTGIRKRDVTSLKNIVINTAAIRRCEIIIDALFGTGVTKDINGHYVELISQINRSGVKVVSLDLPSGFFSDSIEIPSFFIRAHETVTIGLPKLPLLLHPMKRHCGRLHIRNIGFSEDSLASVDSVFSWYDDSEAKKDIPPRPDHSHKNMFGHLGIWAGSENRNGAAYLAGEAAIRSGVGLVTLYCDRSIWSVLSSKFHEVMVQPVDEAMPLLKTGIHEKKVILAGPGLGVSSERHADLKDLLSTLKGIVILDADALNMIAEDLTLLDIVRNRSVLTPHVGEMERLLGRKIDLQKREDIKAVHGFSIQYQAVIVLKSSDTYIFHPLEEQVWINSTGNPGLAKAGSGDVLAGILAGVVCQADELSHRGLLTFSLLRHVLFSVWLHGKAADFGVKKKGVRSLLASDVIDSIPDAYGCLE